MSWLDRPAATSRSTSSSRPVSGSIRPGTAARAGRVPGTGQALPKARWSRARKAERDPGRGLVGSLGRDQQAGGVAIERPSSAKTRTWPCWPPRLSIPARTVTASLSRPLAARARARKARLDDAASPLLGDRCDVQPVQQRERPAGLALGEQEAGQHQVPRLASVVRLVVRLEAAFGYPAGGGGQVALSRSSSLACWARTD